MFAVTPYNATYHVVTMDGGRTIERWKACRVIGVVDEAYGPKYLIEIRSKDGMFCLDKAELIRKPAPGTG